jgi:hypothetical protein
MSQTQLDRMEGKLDTFIALANERAIDMEGRVKALETNQKNAGWLASWISVIVASIVTYFVTAFSGHKP